MRMRLISWMYCNHFGYISMSVDAAFLCELTSFKPLITVREVKYRRTRSVDIFALSRNFFFFFFFFGGGGGSSLCWDALSSSHLDIFSACDLDSHVCNYSTTLSSVMESHAPLKMKTIISRPTVPWYNEDIHKANLLRRTEGRKKMEENKTGNRFSAI